MSVSADHYVNNINHELWLIQCPILHLCPNVWRTSPRVNDWINNNEANEFSTKTYLNCMQRVTFRTVTLWGCPVAVHLNDDGSDKTHNHVQNIQMSEQRERVEQSTDFFLWPSPTEKLCKIPSILLAKVHSHKEMRIFALPLWSVNPPLDRIASHTTYRHTFPKCIRAKPPTDPIPSQYTFCHSNICTTWSA